MNKNDKLIIKNFRNIHSADYRELEKIIKKVIDNDKLSTQVADIIDGESKYVDKINYGDIKIKLKEYSSSRIDLSMDIYIKPSEFFEINKNNFRRVLWSSDDISKTNYIKEIKNRLTKFNAPENRRNLIFMKSIIKIADEYKNASKKRLVQTHLMEVLNIRFNTIIDDDVIRNYVNKQHKKVDAELQKTEGSDISLELINDDIEFRKLFIKVPNLTNLYNTTSMSDVISEAFKINNPTAEQISKCIVRYKHLALSKDVLKVAQKELSDRSDYGQLKIDLTTWDDQSLVEILEPILERNKSIFADRLRNDWDFLIKLLNNLNNSKIKEINKTNKNRYYLIKA